MSIGINYNHRYMKVCGIFNPQEFLEYISKLGFKNMYVQLGEESYNFLLNKENITRVRNAKAKYGIQIVIHCPNSISILDKKFEFHFGKILNICKLLSSRHIVIDLPRVQSSQDKIISNKLDYTDVIDMKICLENTSSGYYSDIDNVLKLLKTNPKFYFAFDIGHLNVSRKGNLKSVIEDLEEIEKNLQLIKIFHAHMNYGVEDNHLPVFPDREGKLNPLYFLTKRIIKSLTNAIIIEESYPRSEYDLKKVISLLHLISTGKF